MGDVESYCHTPAPERRAARRLCAGWRGKGGRARRSQLKIGRNVQFLPSSALYENKVNKTVTALYQKLKIQDMPLNNREKYLDLMCFPDIYSATPLSASGTPIRRRRRAILADKENSGFTEKNGISKYGSVRYLTAPREEERY